MVKPTWLDFRSSVVIRVLDLTKGLITEGFHDAEGKGDGAYCWTAGKSVWVVPTIDGTDKYKVRLIALGGHPKRKRMLRLSIGGVKKELQVGTRKQVYDVEFVSEELRHFGSWNWWQK